MGLVALPEGLAAFPLLGAAALAREPAAALAADAFAAACLVAAFRAAGDLAAVFLAVVFFADALLLVAFCVVALGFLAALLPDALAVPFVAALAAARARVRVDLVDAAMICLWFLTVLVTPRTADAGNSKGA